jgi:predicted outer membrane repeat protein
MIKRHSDNITRSGEGAIFIGPGLSYDCSYFKNSITNCTFEGNKADHVGGAIRLFHIDDRNVIKNCKFTDNFANNRVSNILVQYGHGLGDKLAKEWGNTSNAMKYNHNANGVSVVNK